MQFSQISMREWIALVMFTCISVAALSYGGVCQSLFSSLAFLVLVAMIICAFVGTGEFRVYSIGFVVPVIFYLVSIFLIGGTDDYGQLDPSYKLPTTNLFAPLYGVFVKHEYVDSATGAVVENYEGSIVGVGAPTGLGAPTGFGASGGVFLRQNVSMASFMASAHGCCALALGWAGARFALWVYSANRKHPQGAG